MALETLFKIEDKFRNLQFVTQIRRDPELGEQLYLVDEDNTKPYGNLCLSFHQALGDAVKDQIGCFTFLKAQFESSAFRAGLPGCAVDEQQRLLYILFLAAPSHIDEKVITLKLFHLHYEAVDRFGYRRVVVQEGARIKVQNQIVCHNPPPPRFLLFSPKIVSLSICPATGKLVTGYITGGYELSDLDRPTLMAIFPVDLVYDQQQQKARAKATNHRLPLMTPLQSDQLHLHSMVFSRSNRLLFWLGVRPYIPYVPTSEEIQPTLQDDGCVILKSFIPGKASNGQLNQIKIDPVKLVKNFLPKSVFGNFLSQIPNTANQHVFFGAHLELLGHVNKYVVFSFHQNYIMAVKWPKEWYKLSKLPPIGVSKVMLLDKEKNGGEIDAAFLHGTDLYLKSQLGDAQVVRRIGLGHKFKDYRHCTFCGKEENGKKSNKDRKRVSKFKVCRICKELNFHLFYSDPTLACHYCSNECVRKDWKRHKIIHNKEAKDRK